MGEYEIWVYFGLYSPQLEAEEEQQQEHDKLSFLLFFLLLPLVVNYFLKKVFH